MAIEANEFYQEPPGAILPFGGHRGHGLGVIAEIRAGAMAGSGCSQPDADPLINGMLSVRIDPERIPREVESEQGVSQFVRFVKSSRRVESEKPILMPGEIEAQMRSARLAEGI